MTGNVTNDRIYEITAATIAILVVGGAVMLAILNAVLHSGMIEPPGWLTTAVGAVIGFYFARRTQAADRIAYLARLESDGERTEQ